jgi:mono/diheme cytochrome c family protein
MKQVGMDMKPAEAAQLARQSENALLQRLHNGGQDMPAFQHLNEEEIRALVAHLRELAEVPGAAGRQLTVRETPERIGEHIVKSTCHTCHSASGENPDAQQLADGAIPPLSVLTTRVSQAQFVRKVTQGATIEMGTPALTYRGRMPVFYYLSKEEAADAYLYLARYAPTDEAPLEPAIAAAQDMAEWHAGDPPPAAHASLEEKPAPSTAGEHASDIRPMQAALVAASLVSLLLLGMAGFTVRECIRLSLRKAESAGRPGQPPASPNTFSKRLERQKIA